LVGCLQENEPGKRYAKFMSKKGSMSILLEQRHSESPFIETIMHGHTVSEKSVIRPAENHWHMVFVKHQGAVKPIVVGPLTISGIASWKKDAEILWIKFKPGTFMPKLPFKQLIDKETFLPDATSQSFWLHGSAWQIPRFEDVETFVDWLMRDEVLAHDPIVKAVLQNRPQDLSPRTVRHRFLQATGLSQNDIRQIQRAQHTEALLRQGVSIADAVYQAGYFDQPHLTRSLKQWVGHTPAQIIGSSAL
jgi:AraC-like DNA-binding protein